jgi:hypothetical protein
MDVPPPMDEARFWSLIEAARADIDVAALNNQDEVLDIQSERLTELLGQLNPVEVIAFSERFWERMAIAYRWPLWNAAYWLLGGCGNDGFTDFRASLISLGPERFYQVVNDPDSLADITDKAGVPYLGSEGFQYLATRVYRSKTGGQIPFGPAPEVPPAPSGERIDVEDGEAFAKRFPRLYAKYPEIGD